MALTFIYTAKIVVLMSHKNLCTLIATIFTLFGGVNSTCNVRVCGDYTCRCVCLYSLSCVQLTHY